MIIQNGRVKANGIEIYYEIHGSGEPLVLIEGLGYSRWMWYKQVPALSERYRVIVFDNRGVGDTDKPDSEYSIELMADDAAALLEALGIGSAHVLGISLGGFVAQEVALRHPEIVRSLILGSTSSGSRNSVAKYSQLWNGYLKFWGFLPEMLEMNGKASVPVHIEPYYGLPREEKIRYGLMSAFTPDYFRDHPDEIDRIVEWRLDEPQPAYAWKRQFMAGVNFDSTDRVHDINAPTLVITGSEDRIVSPESSKELAERIPNSRFVSIEGSGHLVFIEHSEQFNDRVLGFLDEVREQNNKLAQMGADGGGWWNKVISLLRKRRRRSRSQTAGPLCQSTSSPSQ